METTSESFDNNSEETTETQESENDSDDSVTDDSASIPHSHESTEKAGEKSTVTIYNVFSFLNRMSLSFIKNIKSRVVKIYKNMSIFYEQNQYN